MPSNDIENINHEGASQSATKKRHKSSNEDSNKRDSNVRTAAFAIAKFCDDHYIFSALFGTFSGLWYSLILTYLGLDWHLVYITKVNQKGLTLLGWFITILVLIWNLVFLLSDKIRDAAGNKKYADLQGQLDLHQTLFMYENDAINNRYHDLVVLIEQVKNGEKRAPKVFTAPCIRLKEQLDSLQNVLCKLLSSPDYIMKRTNLYVSLAYRFPREDDDNTWHWAENSDVKGLNLNTLIQKENTTFSVLLNKVKKGKEGNSCFYNSKQQALDNNQYVSDHLDQYSDTKSGHKLQGSIACFYFSILSSDAATSDATIIEFIINITTYSKKFVDTEDKDVENTVCNNINDYVLEAYLPFIKENLCLYYLYYLYGKQQPKSRGKIQLRSESSVSNSD